MALPAKNRLTLSQRSTFKGRKVVQDGFTVIANSQKGILKAAVVVSKKTAKKATDRNRIKRLVSESIRTNLQRIKFEGEIVVIITRNLAHLKKDQMDVKLLGIINKL